MFLLSKRVGILRKKSALEFSGPQNCRGLAQPDPFRDRKLVTFQSRSLKLFARVLHIGTSDERGSWFYATSVQLLIGRPGFSLLFNETGVENPTLQIVSNRDQNTESEEAQATPRATSAEYNPTNSQFISQINIMLKSHAASTAM